MLVYEYVDNGNLEQWLHGDGGPVSPLTWDIRMKIAIGTAKGCSILAFMSPFLFLSSFWFQMISIVLILQVYVNQSIYMIWASIKFWIQSLPFLYDFPLIWWSMIHLTPYLPTKIVLSCNCHHLGLTWIVFFDKASGTVVVARWQFHEHLNLLFFLKFIFSHLSFLWSFTVSYIFCRLAYLHEGLEPKVVHRDVKSSNILLDKKWNPKVSDFGLAKLLGSESSYVTTRVMGTFGFVLSHIPNSIVQ